MHIVAYVAFCVVISVLPVLYCVVRIPDTQISVSYGLLPLIRFSSGVC